MKLRIHQKRRNSSHPYNTSSLDKPEMQHCLCACICRHKKTAGRYRKPNPFSIPSRFLISACCHALCCLSQAYNNLPAVFKAPYNPDLKPTARLPDLRPGISYSILFFDPEFYTGLVACTVSHSQPVSACCLYFLSRRNFPAV